MLRMYDGHVLRKYDGHVMKKGGWSCVEEV